MTNVAVVLGSTRPGRVGEGVAQWVVSEANKVEGVNASVVDLADFELPFFAEPMPPSMEAPKQPEAVRFAQVLGAADAVVFVTPEYNQSIPGVLKNAIDYLPPAAMEGKKIGLVGYSWRSAPAGIGGSTTAGIGRLLSSRRRAAVVGRSSGQRVRAPLPPGRGALTLSGGGAQIHEGSHMWSLQNS